MEGKGGCCKAGSGPKNQAIRCGKNEAFERITTFFEKESQGMEVDRGLPLTSPCERHVGRLAYQL